MKRQRNPPPRLHWPTHGASLQSTNTKNELSSSYSLQSNGSDPKRSVLSKKKSESRRRKKKNDQFDPSDGFSKSQNSYHQTESVHIPSGGDQNDNRMWTDKYSHVENIKDLCVHPRKIKEVRDWIESAICASSRSQSNGTIGCKMLLLVGGPGIGKSTMCRVLAKELNLDVLEWNDLHLTISKYGSDTTSSMNSLLSNNYQSQLRSFEEYLQSAGTGFNSLNLTQSTCDDDSIIFDGKNFKNQSTTRNGSILLIEEIPNLHNLDSEEKFRAIMQQHIQVSKHPTILIFSNVSEGKATPSDLERLIPPPLLYNPTKVKIIQCNPVTLSKMRKCLEIIARKERISLPIGLIDEIYNNSGGDLRNAIMTMQFQLTGWNKQLSRNSNVGIQQKNRYGRDKKLSPFHALGRLLYAKRLPFASTEESFSKKKETFFERSKAAERPNGLWCDKKRPPLSFIPEDVVGSSEMNLSGICSFLSYQCPNFYTDIEELSEAFSIFSDAALLLEKEFDSQRDQSDKIFPSGYISSLAGRSVAETNRHPATSKFRQLDAPKIFDVLRKNRLNAEKIIKLRSRLCFNSYTFEETENESTSILPLNASIGHSFSFVVEELHFIRTIFPSEINGTLTNLYSLQGPNNAKQTDDSEGGRESILRNQEKILLIDDIIDYDDDNEALKPHTATVLPFTKHQYNSSEANQTNEVIVID